MIPAYHATTYWVLGPRPLALKIGVVALELDSLTGGGMGGGIAFITACNPASRPLPTDENAKRMRKALETLSEGTKKWLPGVGLSDDGCWCEPSVLAWPLGRDEALTLALAWGQNAWIHIGGDWIPRLELTGGWI